MELYREGYLLLRAVKIEIVDSGSRYVECLDDFTTINELINSI